MKRKLSAVVGNDKEETQVKPGRPLKFKSPDQIVMICKKYFAAAAKSKNPLTINGLALALGTTRDVLMDYEVKYGDEFSNVIKWAKTMVQEYAERRLFGPNPSGAIFALKNYGWRDDRFIGIGPDNTRPLTEERKLELKAMLGAMYKRSEYTADLRPSQSQLEDKGQE